MCKPTKMSFPYPAPVPVGHEVEVVWPELNTGLLGSKMEVLDQCSFVRDVQTGVFYGASVAFDAVDEGNDVGRRITGKVVYARLVTHNVASGTNAYTQTELWLEVTAE